MFCLKDVSYHIYDLSSITRGGAKFLGPAYVCVFFGWGLLVDMNLTGNKVFV
jgi:hypothetical protein